MKDAVVVVICLLAGGSMAYGTAYALSPPVTLPVKLPGSPQAAVLSGTIRSVDRAGHSIIIDAVSPYYYREHAPFRIAYSDKTRISALRDAGPQSTTTPDDLSEGATISIRLPRTAGPLSAAFIRIQ